MGILSLWWNKVHASRLVTETTPTRSKSRNQSKYSEHITDGDPPNEKPPDKPDIGSYCIRVQVDMYDGPYEVANVVGWHTSPEIIRHTQETCEVRKDRGKGQRCGDPSVTFTKFQKKCAQPTIEIQRRPIPPT